jgi:glycosyltransferase involved in cell wall biosynthesis
VIAQTYGRWEVIIVDNHSSDSTDNVVAGFHDSRIALLKIQNNGVVAASRNLGIKQAQGEYIAFLDSDDWWLPCKLERSVRILETSTDVVYHDLFLATKPGQRAFWRRARTCHLKSPVFENLIANGTTLNTSSVVVRRKVLQKINGFSEDESLIGAEDFDAWLRAAKVTERFARVPGALGYYWAGGGNLSDPQRTLKTLATLEGRYADIIGRVAPRAYASWISYGKGRAHYRLGGREMARMHLERVQWRHAPYSMSLKSLWMLLLIRLDCHPGKWFIPRV